MWHPRPPVWVIKTFFCNWECSKISLIVSTWPAFLAEPATREWDKGKCYSWVGFCLIFKYQVRLKMLAMYCRWRKKKKVWHVDQLFLNFFFREKKNFFRNPYILNFHHIFGLLPEGVLLKVLLKGTFLWYSWRVLLKGTPEGYSWRVLLKGTPEGYSWKVLLNGTPEGYSWLKGTPQWYSSKVLLQDTPLMYSWRVFLYGITIRYSCWVLLYDTLVGYSCRVLL